MSSKVSLSTILLLFYRHNDHNEVLFIYKIISVFKLGTCRHSVSLQMLSLMCNVNTAYQITPSDLKRKRCEACQAVCVQVVRVQPNLITSSRVRHVSLIQNLSLPHSHVIMVTRYGQIMQS